MDSVEMAKAISSLPLTVLLVLVLVGGYVEWWVYGTLHRAQVKDLEQRAERAEARALLWENRYFDVHNKDTQRDHQS